MVLSQCYYSKIILEFSAQIFNPICKTKKKQKKIEQIEQIERKTNNKKTKISQYFQILPDWSTMEVEWKSTLSTADNITLMAFWGFFIFFNLKNQGGISFTDRRQISFLMLSKQICSPCNRCFLGKFEDNKFDRILLRLEAKLGDGHLVHFSPVLIQQQTTRSKFLHVTLLYSKTVWLWPWTVACINLDPGFVPVGILSCRNAVAYSEFSKMEVFCQNS